MAHNPDPRAQRGFQFHLRHLFLLVTLQAIYFGLVRLCGPFVATLLLGAFLLPALIVLLRIESVLWGAVMGTLAAGGMLLLVALAFGPIPGEQMIVACFLYPLLGYTVGVLGAFDRQARLGL